MYKSIFIIFLGILFSLSINSVFAATPSKIQTSNDIIISLNEVNDSALKIISSLSNENKAKVQELVKSEKEHKKLLDNLNLGSDVNQIKNILSKSYYQNLPLYKKINLNLANLYIKDYQLYLTYIELKIKELKLTETFNEKKDRILKSMGRNNSTSMNLLKSNDKIYSKLSSVQKKLYNSLVSYPMNTEFMNIYKNFDSSASQKTILQKGTVVNNKYTLIAKKISPSAIQLVNNNSTGFTLAVNEFLKK